MNKLYFNQIFFPVLWSFPKFSLLQQVLIGNIGEHPITLFEPPTLSIIKYFISLNNLWLTISWSLNIQSYPEVAFEKKIIHKTNIDSVLSICENNLRISLCEVRIYTLKLRHTHKINANLAAQKQIFQMVSIFKIFCVNYN